MMASANQLEKFLGRWHSAKIDTVAYLMTLQENARKLGVLPRSCIPLAIESADSLRFLWTTLSIEGAALYIESALFYRMAGFLEIPRKRKSLESTEHTLYICNH